VLLPTHTHTQEIACRTLTWERHREVWRDTAAFTSTLGAPASALGAIEGVSDGLAGLVRLGGGAFADEPDRRRQVAIVGYTTTAVLSAGIGAATATWQVGCSAPGPGPPGASEFPLATPSWADVVPCAAFGRAYGFEQAMDNLAAIVGPLLAIDLVVAVGTVAPPPSAVWPSSAASSSGNSIQPTPGGGRVSADRHVGRGSWLW
jgi:hypothetical protein